MAHRGRPGWRSSCSAISRFWPGSTRRPSYFDETHYVPAARQFAATHFAIRRQSGAPPLAKELMALSIWMFGDNPSAGAP